MRNGRPGTHIPEYHPHPSHCRSAREPGLRTGRCPPRGTSPYKELLSLKVPGLYGGQNHGCSSKLQNSVKQVFLCEQREAAQLRTSHPAGREEEASALGCQDQPSENQSTRCHLLADLPSAHCPFKRGTHTPPLYPTVLYQASICASQDCCRQLGLPLLPKLLDKEPMSPLQPVFLISLPCLS